MKKKLLSMQPDIEPILKMNEPYTPVPEDFEKAA